MVAGAVRRPPFALLQLSQTHGLVAVGAAAMIDGAWSHTGATRLDLVNSAPLRVGPLECSAMIDPQPFTPVASYALPGSGDASHVRTPLIDVHIWGRAAFTAWPTNRP